MRISNLLKNDTVVSANCSFFRATTMMLVAIAVALAGFLKPVEVEAQTWCDDIKLSYRHISDCCIEITLTPPPIGPIPVLVRQKNKNGKLDGPYIWDGGTGYPGVPFNPETMVKVPWALSANGYLVYPKTHGIMYPTEYYKDTLCVLPGEDQIHYLVSVYYGLGACPVFENTIQMPNAENCCPCPENPSDWLTLKIEYEADECGEEMCKVTPVLTIPEDITCFGFYYLTLTSSEGEYHFEGNISDGFPSICVAKGTTVKAEFALYNTEHYSPRTCYLEVTSEPCEEPLPEPCTPDCFDDKWVIAKPVTMLIPGTRCTVTITYAHRFACGVYQDLQILKIEFTAGICESYPIDTLYKHAVGGIIANSWELMGFLPRYPGDCFTQWRVANAGCWSGEIIGFYVYPDGYTRKYRWTPCEFDDDPMPCCWQSFVVCRLVNGKVNIIPGGSYNPVVWCEDNGEPVQHIPCRPACAWAGAVNGEFEPIFSGPGGQKISIASELGCNINVNFAENLLGISIESETVATATLDIYTTDGTRVATRTFELSKGLNVYNYSTLNYISGAYIYSITINDNLVFDGQFVIVR